MPQLNLSRQPQPPQSVVSRSNYDRLKGLRWCRIGHLLAGAPHAEVIDSRSTRGNTIRCVCVQTVRYRLDDVYNMCAYAFTVGWPTDGAFNYAYPMNGTDNS